MTESYMEGQKNIKNQIKYFCIVFPEILVMANLTPCDMQELFGSYWFILVEINENILTFRSRSYEHWLKELIHGTAFRCYCVTMVFLPSKKKNYWDKRQKCCISPKKVEGQKCLRWVEWKGGKNVYTNLFSL